MQVPEGATAGDMLALHMEGGEVLEVVVPQGAVHGDTFQVPVSAGAVSAEDAASGAPAAVCFRLGAEVRSMIFGQTGAPD